MTPDADEGGEGTTLAPDDAFAVLANETRMEMLRVLADEGGTLPFSELRSRVGMRDSGQFHYHLDKLTGHFIRKTDDGYDIRMRGRRVIQAVLSGAVTDAPELERTEIDMSCPYCDAPIEVRFTEEQVRAYCTTCTGTFGSEEGHLGTVFLPPAGIQGRTPLEILEAALTWGNLEWLAGASGLCPRCSAPIDTSVTVCEDHDTNNGVCDRCNRYHQVRCDSVCTNCIYSFGGAFALQFGTDPDFLSFQIDHDLNPISPEQVSTFMTMTLDYEEEVSSMEPFEARFTFTLDEEALSLTVDDNLNVIDATRHETQEPT